MSDTDIMPQEVQVDRITFDLINLFFSSFDMTEPQPMFKVLVQPQQTGPLTLEILRGARLHYAAHYHLLVTEDPSLPFYHVVARDPSRLTIELAPYEEWLKTAH